MERIREFLEMHKVLNIGYIESGIPHVCAVWYSYEIDEGVTLYFVSSPSSRHGNVFLKQSQVAFTINRDLQEWKSIQGIQGRGYVKKSDASFSKFTERFTFAENLITKNFELYVLKVNWIRIIDNTVKFGYKEERFFELDPQ